MASSSATIRPEAIPRALDSGARYLDVRTVEEFEQGRLPGALNIPLMFGSLSGLEENPRFLEEVAACIPVHTPLIVGCHGGARARTAAGALSRRGYQVQLDEDGWGGGTDPFGRRRLGWKDRATAIERGPGAAGEYRALLLRAGLADRSRPGG
jgi:rhodanese-related sulfurtransferase